EGTLVLQTGMITLREELQKEFRTELRSTEGRLQTELGDKIEKVDVKLTTALERLNQHEERINKLEGKVGHF
ncbi:MAG: hypothetical protein U9O41_04895, partial [Candidatus Aerophobetes bacterium]|nr:hypothetical protein [Candidatus Aerophobetes bacterium]